MVISDEIWSDLILDAHHHIPTQSVGEDARNRTIAFYAPSKTFNLAGLVGSYHVVYDRYLRDRLESSGARTAYNNMNVLSMHALIGAYSEDGEAWLDELLKVLSRNLRIGFDYFDAIEGVRLARPQGTYMLFLDCEEWCRAHGLAMDELLRQGWDVGIGWQDGRAFGGDWTIRMNFALPLARVEETMRRLDGHVFVR